MAGPCTDVCQVIESNSLTNIVDFTKGRLQIKSTLEPQPTGTRFNFEFKTASLKWRNFEFPIPPIGKGYGDILYLDSDLRVQKDSRGDYLVCVKE